MAFEAIGLLHLNPELDPPRFLIARDVLKGALGHWLMGRALDRYAWGSFGRSGRASRRTYTSRRERASQGETLTAPQREAVAFAASAWGSTSTVEELAFCPETSQVDGAFAVDTDLTSEERIEVAVLLPDGLVPAVAKAPVAKRPVTKKTHAPSAVTTPESAPSPTTTTGELTTADLRARGYGPAEVKAMLKSGALERVSFG